MTMRTTIRLPLGLILLLLLFPEPGEAGDGRTTFGRNVSGRPGIGILSGEAPLGIRYLWSPKGGVEAGFGFLRRSGVDETTIVLEGAGLVALAPGDNLNAFARPGASFTSESGPGGTTSTVQLNLALQIEYFLSPGFSLTASTGLTLDFESGPLQADGSSPDRTRFRTEGGTLTRVGFFFYLPKRRGR